MQGDQRKEKMCLKGGRQNRKRRMKEEGRNEGGRDE